MRRTGKDRGSRVLFGRRAGYDVKVALSVLLLVVVGGGCVRCLRTQQRAECRCQLFDPGSGGSFLLFEGGWAAWSGIPLVLKGLHSLSVGGGACVDARSNAAFAVSGEVIYPAASALVGVVGCDSSTESLILAQDERWRRA